MFRNRLRPEALEIADAQERQSPCGLWRS
ncbi:hypothetical protein NOCA2790009 [metagenome]|uniref:Uncharacterized protein n=1 Tax=metagenome TaxID=256318 RepID=A0A2P2CET7_9ZZZZ